MQIDDVTFDELRPARGRSRARVHAKVIDRIAADHPKAIAYDVQFTERSDRSNDDDRAAPGDREGARQGRARHHRGRTAGQDDDPRRRRRAEGDRRAPRRTALLPPDPGGVTARALRRRQAGDARGGRRPRWPTGTQVKPRRLRRERHAPGSTTTGRRARSRPSRSRRVVAGQDATRHLPGQDRGGRPVGAVPPGRAPHLHDRGRRADGRAPRSRRTRSTPCAAGSRSSRRRRGSTCS